MYDVSPFIAPVKSQPERSLELVTSDADLIVFRQSRSATAMADLVRESFNTAHPATDIR